MATETKDEAVKKDTVVSTANFLRFVRFDVKSFAGIHEDMKLAIVFDDPKKRIVGFSGDQGTGKTSSLQALYTLCGGMPPKNAINEKDKNIDEELVFERNGEKYVVRATKGSFTVTKFDKDGNRSKMDSPKDFLKRVIGPIGLNPMALKGMKGPEQIEWLRSLTTFTKEQLELEADILSKKETDYKKRTEVNRVVKQLEGEVLSTGYYVWDNENKVFKATELFVADTNTVAKSELNEDIVAQNLKDAENKKNEWQKASEGLEQMRTKKFEKTLEIEELRRKLAQAEHEEKELLDRIEKGEKWIEENKGVTEVYDKAFEAMRQLGDVKMKNQNLTSVADKIKLHTTKEEEAVMLNGKLDEYDKLHKQFVQSFTPNIEGFEVVVPGIDSKKAEGLYYKEKTMIMLSESEIFELYLQLLASQNVKVTIIENITSLGTAAIERINWFAEQMGGYVFYSAMERGKEKLGFQFLDKIKN